MIDSKNHTHCFEVSIRILFCKEDDSWVAHDLEMDLLGYGKTTQLALKDLQKSIEAQISFAAFKGHPETIFFLAPPEIVKRWESAQVSTLKQAISGNKETASNLKVKAAVVTFSKEQIAQLVAKKPTGSPMNSPREQWEPTLAAA
jgi:hypothetical protein